MPVSRLPVLPPVLKNTEKVRWRYVGGSGRTVEPAYRRKAGGSNAGSARVASALKLSVAARVMGRRFAVSPARQREKRPWYAQRHAVLFRNQCQPSL